MKIKVALLEKDEAYLKKFAAVFNKKYIEKIQLYFATDSGLIEDILGKNKIDVLLANEEFEIDLKKLPKRCGFAYILDNNLLSQNAEGIRLIGKYQKVEMIYKEILNIYAEKATLISGIQQDGDLKTNIVFVTSPAGGVGKTTMAYICARNFARTGKKVLYIDLDIWGDCSLCFSDVGQMDFSEVVYALKSQKSNISLKMESAVKKDASGVYFYSPTKTALDMTEVLLDDVRAMFKILISEGKYDYIIVDKPFDLSDIVYEIIKNARHILLVSHGSEVTNRKIVRAYETLEILEDKKDLSLMNRLSIIYNKFSNKTSKMLDGLDIKTLGGIQKYENASTQQILNELQGSQIFNSIM